MAWHSTRLALGCYFFTFFLLVPLPSAEAGTRWSDVSALHELRVSWNSTALMQNWTWGSDPCWNNWLGVYCSQEIVISLNLYQADLMGTLSPAIGKLTNLSYLNLAGNPGLSGPIPEEIGNLSHLYIMDLSNCSFSGRIPFGLGNLKKLSSIYLNNNQLSGALPNTIGWLPNILQLSLACNNLSGGIPVSLPNGYTVGLNNLTSLLILDLTNNNLSGGIPATLGQMENLTTLYLGNNALIGCLQCATSAGGNYGLDNLTQVRSIDISKNALSGPLPDLFLQLPLINRLNLSYNQFSGILDGNLRNSGHVDVLLNYNNISVVANLPSPFLDPVYRGPSALENMSSQEVNTCAKIVRLLEGNPACENQSYPIADACRYSTRMQGPPYWQQQTTCSTLCDQNSVVHPSTCNCSYPLVCNMYFGWNQTYGLVGSRVGDLRRSMATELKLEFEQIWVERAMFQNSSESQLLAKLLFYPPATTTQWGLPEVTSVQSQLGNKTINLVEYSPYGLLSAVLHVPPFIEGTANTTTAVKPNHHTLPIILGAIGGVLAFVVLSGLILCYVNHRRGPRQPPLDYSSEIFSLNRQQYPSCFIMYEEIKYATRNFNKGNRIGEGAYGAVYKGTMRDGTEVAVKELPLNAKQGVDDFVNEVELVQSLQHKNLVKLRGCSVNGSSRLLVYEYVENKSLAQALFDPTKALLLEWPFRYNIALGMAKGLAHLHSKGSRQQRLAHGDIKASSILLDRRLEPKIADFGLARLCQMNSRKVLTRIDGKRGYVAPEYALHGQLQPKTDVFSFGIVALELITGRENMNSDLPRDEQYLLAWAWKLYEEQRVLDLIDPKVREGVDEEQAHLLIRVALLCSQGDPMSRPNMMRVVSLLSGDSPVPDVPTRPTFLGIAEPNESTPRPDSITTW